MSIERTDMSKMAAQIMKDGDHSSTALRLIKEREKMASEALRIRNDMNETAQRNVEYKRRTREDFLNADIDLRGYIIFKD